MAPGGDALTTTEDGKTVLRGGFRTVLEDSNEYHVKHPLQSHWTLHQKIGGVQGTSSRSVSQSDWEKQLHMSVTIGTVEDFWCLYNEMQPIETIPVDCDYFFMRHGVQPMWEDPANAGGGELRFQVSRSMDVAAIWQRALLFLVGCQADDYGVINGLQYAYRSTRARMCLWLAATTPEALERLRAQYLAALSEVTPAASLRIEYSPFKQGGGGRGERSERSHGSDRPERSYGGERSERSYGGDRPERSYGGERSERSHGGERRDDGRGPRSFRRGPPGDAPTSPSGGMVRRH